MTWVRLDDEFAQHPKVVSLSYRARWLHIAALCYSNRLLTDGFIPVAMVASLCPQEPTDPIDQSPGRLADDLCAIGLWETAPRDGLLGFQIHDFSEYQPSKREVLSARKRTRAIRAAAGKNGGIQSQAKREAKREANRVAKREANGMRGGKQTASKPGSNPQANREQTAKQMSSPVPVPKDQDQDQDLVHPERSEGALTPVGARAIRAPRLPARETGTNAAFKTLCALVKAEWTACRQTARTALDEGDFLEHCKVLAARAHLPYDSPTLAAALDAVRPGLQRQEAAAR